VLTEEASERLIAKEAEKAASLTTVESSILNQVTDVKGPDGMKVLHHGAGVKQDPNEVKKRFTIEAKRSFKEFSRIQKRSKILSTKQSRYLIEFHVPTCVL